MDQKQIDFIRSRWSGRACGSDIQQLVDEIVRLSEIVENQTNTIEDGLLDRLDAQFETHEPHKDENREEFP